MNDLSARKMVQRLANGGRLSSDELSAVRSELRNPTPQSDVHNLIRVLARAVPSSSASDVEIAEKILRESRDDWWTQGAIYALAHEWKLGHLYLNDLLLFTRPSAWSEHSNSAIASLSVIGDYLSDTQDPNVYRFLLDLYEQDQSLEAVNSEEFRTLHLSCVIEALDRGIRGDAALLDPIKISSLQDIPKSLIRAATSKAVLH